MPLNLESQSITEVKRLSSGEKSYIVNMNNEIRADKLSFSGKKLEPIHNTVDITPVPDGTYCMQASLYYALRTLGEDVTVDQCIAALGEHESKIDLSSISNDTLENIELERGKPVNVNVKFKRESTAKEFNRAGFKVDNDKDVISPMMESLRDGNVLIVGIKTPDYFIGEIGRQEREKEEHAVAVVDYDFNEYGAPIFKLFDGRIDIPIWVPARRLVEQSYLSHLELSRIPLQAAA